MEFDDDSFDSVVTAFGLNSAQDPGRIVKEMKRVCKPGGKIVIIETGKSCWESMNYKILIWYLLNYSTDLNLRNWDRIIKEEDFAQVKKARKLNGRLFLYEILK